MNDSQKAILRLICYGTLMMAALVFVGWMSSEPNNEEHVAELTVFSKFSDQSQDVFFISTNEYGPQTLILVSRETWDHIGVGKTYKFHVLIKRTRFSNRETLAAYLLSTTK